MEEILRRAEIRRYGVPTEKLNFQHMSPNRNVKRNKYFEDVILLLFLSLQGIVSETSRKIKEFGKQIELEKIFHHLKNK